ncbi:thioesterase family protein [Streptomyces spongiicola]|uniref:Thioesterase family protein n=1 Tax=Streptomyces spongiicola TaxID=1690221 RepID=A0A2S1Z0U4_9ACTN|nr:thioesterase family protein [Streptomyces spongiicola]AWK09912.1 thioesterase family protein [Streptomyces spongiicola]GBQ03867.1 thioesterase family protein [Streptomyces spongiicola]
MTELPAFYERISEDRFSPTEHTRGPWDAGSQHAGPPAALLGRALEERPGARADMRLARVTYEIVRPVPIRPLEVTTTVLRTGRGVEIVEAALAPEGGAPVMFARALRVRTLGEPGPAVSEAPQVPSPGGTPETPFLAVPWDVGYHTSMDARFTEGNFREQGPGTCWMRMRMPLVSGEEIRPLDRVLVAADSGNGISNVLDFERQVFVNADLTVHLHRHPAGEWVCVEARTSVDPAGIGLADARLHDEKGPIGRSAQSLFVAPR